MSDTYFEKNSYNVTCSVCGCKRKRAFVRKNWLGRLCCTDRDCWDPKHPYLKPRPPIGPDNKPVPQAQPPLFTNLVINFGTTEWTDLNLTWDSIQWSWTDSNDIYGNPV